MATKKLSAAQQKVLDEARAQIDYARTHTYREWTLKHNGIHSEEELTEICERCRKFGDDPEKIRRNYEERFELQNASYGHWYEDERNGIVLVHCKGQTLHKLAELGYFEIVKDSTGSRGWASDTVKVLNY